jgi:TrpR family trp operon transcriptional repressor
MGNRQFDSLIKTLCRIKSRALMRNFLLDLLTPAERKEIGLRWQLVKYLNQGMSQRSIVRKLKVSLCKITRGSRELKLGHNGFKAVLKQEKSN